MVGFKYFQIYPPSATPLMYPHATGLTTNSSRVDARSPDLAQFPAFASARGHQCVIGPGQGLYLPPGELHHATYTVSACVDCLALSNPAVPLRISLEGFLSSPGQNRGTTQTSPQVCHAACWV